MNILRKVPAEQPDWTNYFYNLLGLAMARFSKLPVQVLLPADAGFRGFPVSRRTYNKFLPFYCI